MDFCHFLSDRVNKEAITKISEKILKFLKDFEALIKPELDKHTKREEELDKQVQGTI